MHPDIITAVEAAGEVRELGRAAGAREALAHLSAVGEKAGVDEAISERWMEGFDEGVANVDSDAVPWFGHDEYMERSRDLPDQESLGFNPTNLLAALAEIHAYGVQVGHRDAIQAAREQRDTETVPDSDDYVSDPDDPDPDQVEEYQGQVDYVNGLTYVATCLLEQFPDADPDPSWEPA